ncbi:MAG: 3-deoxy-7-phosphoheptulonate synthase [Spirochaetaceae bacterium]|nr:MAG: 3-deoxy-7-phosphoheptulonate synthase [Spirochaetaceae bacterium]
MVIVLERTIREDDKTRLRTFLEERGFRVREIVGENETIFGAVGSVAIDIREVEVRPGVERVIPITKPFKLASRELQKADTVVAVGPIKIGGPRIVMIAGPCSVETEAQIMESARIVRESGAVILRGGAFKPRSSPYAFQGLGEEGLRLLRKAGDEFGMPVVSEIVSTQDVSMFSDYVDLLQIGARNMQNFELLKAVGASGRPVIVKRGLAATIEEWLMAAEYVLAHGSENVILCERGIRTFETYTRNTLDISAIPVVRKLSHLPVIVDPSHATGIRDQVPPVALAGIAAGAAGLIVEVHPDPDRAMSDGPQSLFPDQFEKLMRDVEALAPVVGKELSRIPTRGRSIGAAGTGGARPALSADVTAGPVPVAFQGERGAYSEMALLRFFHDMEYRAMPCRSFRDAFDAVLSGAARYAILPIENSLAGSVHENYDLLLQYPDLTIVGEIKLRVEHSLIAAPGTTISDVRRVYSHPQALAQCHEFLRSHEWELVPFYDTAGSVAHIAEQRENGNAAIANAGAAEVYGMEVIKAGIETNPSNYTRFMILSRDEDDSDTGANMAGLVFSTPDRPGALFSAMQILADAELNLKKLESRPIAGKPWQYMFYVDVELPAGGGAFPDALERLRHVVEDLRVLGIFRAA